MSDQTDEHDGDRPSSPDDATDRRKARPKVKFLGRPRITFDQDGVSLRFALVNRGPHSLGVNFRVSMHGRMLDVQAPQLSLRAGSAPTNVQLRMPLDSGIVEGSKVNVAVVGPGGQTVAASSTGAVTVGLPGGSSVALSTKGIAVTGVLSLGIVTLAWTQWLRPDPEPVGAEPTTSAEVVLPEPEPEPTTSDTEPEDAGPEQWPLVIPAGLVASPRGVPDSNATTEPIPVEVPEPIIVTFDAGPVADEGHRDVAIEVTYLERTVPVGTATLPVALDAAKDGGLSPVGLPLRHDVALFADGGTTHAICEQPQSDGTEKRIGVYTTEPDPASIDVTFWALPNASGAYGLAVDISVEAWLERELDDGVIIDEEQSRCPRRPRAIVWWDSHAAELGDGEEIEVGEDSSDDDVDDVDDEPPDEAESIEYVAEPEAGSLLLGHRGERVRALQDALVGREYLDEADAVGRFGPSTKAAVQRLQADRGLEVDGLAGPATHEALGLPYSFLPGSATISYVAEPATGALLEGHEGPRVRRLQEALVGQGFLDGSIDGEFGPGTQEAVLGFQASVGLDVDGIAGPSTHRALELSYP